MDEISVAGESSVSLMPAADSVTRRFSDGANSIFRPADSARVHRLERLSARLLSVCSRVPLTVIAERSA